MNKYPLANLLISFIAFLFFSSCVPHNDIVDPNTQLKSDIDAINARLASTPGVVKHVTGVSMVITQLGTGMPASLYVDPVVDVDYVGKLFTNGATFDQGTTNELKLSNFITGWQVALSLLPVGSKATLYVPSYYAYGTSAQGSIPANSILIFDINFKAVLLTTAQTAKFKSDSTSIKKYLDSTVTATYDPAGIWYHFTDSTSGEKPTLYDQVKLKYTFKKFTGETISTYEGVPQEGLFDSRVADYFNGIKAGLLHMPEGSKATFYVPSMLAFGSHTIGDKDGATIIEKDSNLIVEMELVEIL